MFFRVGLQLLLISIPIVKYIMNTVNREELDAAVLATSNAYSLVRGGSGSSGASSSDDNGGSHFHFNTFNIHKY